MTELHETVGAIRRACITIADHWDGSLDGPRVTGHVGGKAGSKEPPLPVPVDVLDARRAAHGDLAHWARVVYALVRNAEGGHITQRITDDEQHQPCALAAFVEHWADSLARADRAEAELCADELGGHADKIKRLALPERREWVNVGHCPLTVARDGQSVECGTRLRAYPGRDFITCRGCGHEDTLDWWRRKVLGHRPTLVPATDLVDILLIDLRLSIEPATVRQWHARGKAPRHGKDDRGRWLYDWAQIVALIETPRHERTA